MDKSYLQCNVHNSQNKINDEDFCIYEHTSTCTSLSHTCFWNKKLPQYYYTMWYTASEKQVLRYVLSLEITSTQLGEYTLWHCMMKFLRWKGNVKKIL